MSTDIDADVRPRRGRTWETCSRGRLAWPCWRMTDRERVLYMTGAWRDLQLVRRDGVPAACCRLQINDGAACEG